MPSEHNHNESARIISQFPGAIDICVSVEVRGSVRIRLTRPADICKYTDECAAVLHIMWGYICGRRHRKSV